MFYKKNALKNFARLTGKQLYRSLFLPKLQACNFVKKETPNLDCNKNSSTTNSKYILDILKYRLGKILSYKTKSWLKLEINARKQLQWFSFSVFIDTSEQIYTKVVHRYFVTGIHLYHSFFENKVERLFDVEYSWVTASKTKTRTSLPLPLFLNSTELLNLL